jgi:divalent metal cation (Fe/Co/Zn/Cd) transporter
MKASAICHTATIIFGWFMIAVSIPHSLLGLLELKKGLDNPQLQQLLGNQLVDNIKIVWVFSGVTMMLIGMWVLFNAKEIKAMQRRAWVECYVTSSVILFFGTIFFLLNPHFPQSLHMIGFIIAGFILWIPLMLYRSNFRH